MTFTLDYKAMNTGAVRPTNEEGVVEALVSVTGIKDNVGDIIEPGAYKDTLQKRKPKGVWSHDWNTPVSKAREVRELLPGDPDLPKTLPNGDPWPKEAGALYVKAEFNLKTTAGREAYENVLFFGEDGEWSIGYKVAKGAARRGNDGTRYIKSLDLFEYSPVLFGAASNARTRMPAEVKAMRSAFDSDEEFKAALIAALESKETQIDESFAHEDVVVEVEDEEKSDEEQAPAVEETPVETPAEEPAVEEETPSEEEESADDDDEVTDEELIAILEEDAEKSIPGVEITPTENGAQLHFSTEERTEAKSVTLTPVLIEQLQQAQAQIKALLDLALQVEDTEQKDAVEDLGDQSVEDALNALVAGSIDEKVADEIANIVEKFDSALSAGDEDGIKTYSIAALDAIDSHLEGSNAQQERELKSLAKAIGNEVVASEQKTVEESVELEVTPNEVVTLSEADYKAIFGL